MRSSTPCPTAVHDRAGPSHYRAGLSHYCPITGQDCPTAVHDTARLPQQCHKQSRGVPQLSKDRTGLSHCCPTVVISLVALT